MFTHYVFGHLLLASYLQHPTNISKRAITKTPRKGRHLDSYKTSNFKYSTSHEDQFLS